MVLMEFQLNLCISLGAIGRPGLQGFPGHNLQGPKGTFFLLLFSTICRCMKCIQLVVILCNQKVLVAPLADTAWMDLSAIAERYF